MCGRPKKPWNQSPDTCFGTRTSRREGGNFSHCSTAGFCGALQMTTHKPELYFCSRVQNRREKIKSRNQAVAGLELIWILSSITCYFLLFFFSLQPWKWRTQKKTQTSGTRAEPVSVCISPFIYGTETEPHKWAGGSRSIACAPHRRRGKINARQTLKT